MEKYVLTIPARCDSIGLVCNIGEYMTTAVIIDNNEMTSLVDACREMGLTQSKICYYRVASSQVTRDDNGNETPLLDHLGIKKISQGKREISMIRKDRMFLLKYSVKKGRRVQAEIDYDSKNK